MEIVRSYLIRLDLSLSVCHLYFLSLFLSLCLSFVFMYLSLFFSVCLSPVFSVCHSYFCIYLSISVCLSMLVLKLSKKPRKITSCTSTYMRSRIVIDLRNLELIKLTNYLSLLLYFCTFSSNFIKLRKSIF